MNFHAIFHGLIRHLYYSRITIRGNAELPRQGPLLVLCLHRNGAVDGFLYRAAVPRLTFLIRAKLRNNPIGRLFFSGVEIRRTGDGGTLEDQRAMIETCLRHLDGDEPLAIFPEGTSKLGPKHLPFKSGAARVAHQHVSSGKALTVLPLGIHYECPWGFRSRVEIVRGEPIFLEPSEEKPSLGRIKQRFTAALEEVGLNVPDAHTHDLIHRFAYIATLGSQRQFFTSLKAMEHRLPDEAVRAWDELESRTLSRVILRHQGVPLFPTGSLWLYALSSLLLAGPVLVGALLNLPPVIFGYWTGLRFADDTNVIALWRMFTGIPLFLLWATGMVLIPLLLGLPWLVLGYVVLTSCAICGWYRLKKLTVATWNGLFHPDLRQDALHLHQSILSKLPTPPQDQ